MLSRGVFHQPLFWAVLTHIPNSLRLWQGQMCFVDQEIIFYHTFLSPKARLWPTLVTLLLSSTQPAPKSSHFALFNPPALYFMTYFLQTLCIPSLNYVWHSCSLTSSLPPTAWNPAPLEDAPAPVLLLLSLLLFSQHSLGLCWDQVMPNPTAVDEQHPEQPHNMAPVLPHGCRQCTALSCISCESHRLWWPLQKLNTPSWAIIFGVIPCRARSWTQRSSWVPSLILTTKTTEEPNNFAVSDATAFPQKPHL